MQEAMRFNKGKPQLSFITEANHALAGCADVFEFGEKKYARSNWKKGLGKNEIIDSLLRHLVAYQSGEEFDEDSGLHHLDHVTCNALFLADQYNGKRQEAAHKKLTMADAISEAMSDSFHNSQRGRELYENSSHTRYTG